MERGMPGYDLGAPTRAVFPTSIVFNFCGRMLAAGAA
jgi:hypothetical protein